MIPCTDSGSRRLGPVLARARVDHARELLGVERVAARALEERGLNVGRKHRSLEERVHEARGLVVGERRERDRRRVRLASAPAWPAREELGASGADDEDRHSARPVDEVVDEVEQAVVRPVQVLEDEHERAVARRALRRTVARRRTPRPGGRFRWLRLAPSPTSGRRWPSTHLPSDAPSSDLRDDARASLLAAPAPPSPSRGCPPAP